MSGDRETQAPAGDAPDPDDEWPTHLDDGNPVEEGDLVIVLRELDGEMVPHVYTAGPGGRPPADFSSGGEPGPGAR